MKKYYDIAEFKILNIINFVIEKEFNMFEMHKHMDRLKSIKVCIHDFGEIKPDSSMSFEIPENSQFLTAVGAVRKEFISLENHQI